MKPKFVSIAYEITGNMDDINSSIIALDDTGQLWYLNTPYGTDITKWKKFPDYAFDSGPEPVVKDQCKECEFGAGAHSTSCSVYQERPLTYMCKCGHSRAQHIYEEGACRPGFVCENKCEKFDNAGFRPVTKEERPAGINAAFPCKYCDEIDLVGFPEHVCTGPK